MESRKMVLMNLFAEQHWKCRHKKQTCGPSRGRRRWPELREEHGKNYTVIFKRDTQ